MDEATKNKPPLSTSMFYLWRSLLAIAWADGDCGKEETAYFAKVFDNLARYFDLTQEQRNALGDDLETPSTLGARVLFSHINDPDVRGKLITFAHDLVMLDGELHPNEEDILQRLRLTEDPSLDREALRIEIREIMASGRAKRAQEKAELREEIRSMSHLYAAVDRLLMAFGIDIID